MSYRLGVDVGGTFTDLLLFDDKTGRSHKTKVPSTPDDPSRAVVNGTKDICEIANISPDQIEYFLHGTTVATNACLLYTSPSPRDQRGSRMPSSA